MQQGQEAAAGGQVDHAESNCLQAWVWNTDTACAGMKATVIRGEVCGQSDQRRATPRVSRSVGGGGGG